MPREAPAAKPRKRAPAKAAARIPTAGKRRAVGGPALTRVAVPAAAREEQAPAPPASKRIEEPVWLVRAVLLLFLIGFAAFLAREVYGFVQALG